MKDRYAIIEDTSARKRRVFIAINPKQMQDRITTEKVIWASDRNESIGLGIEFIGDWKIIPISKQNAFLEIL